MASKFVKKLLASVYPFSFSFFILAILYLSFGKMAEFGIVLNIILPLLLLVIFPTVFVVELLTDMKKDDEFEFKVWFKDWFKSSGILYGLITGGIILVLFF